MKCFQPWLLVLPWQKQTGPVKIYKRFFNQILAFNTKQSDWSKIKYRFKLNSLTIRPKLKLNCSPTWHVHSNGCITWGPWYCIYLPSPCQEKYQNHSVRFNWQTMLQPVSFRVQLLDSDLLHLGPLELQIASMQLLGSGRSVHSNVRKGCEPVRCSGSHSTQRFVSNHSHYLLTT